MFSSPFPVGRESLLGFSSDLIFNSADVSPALRGIPPSRKRLLSGFVPLVLRRYRHLMAREQEHRGRVRQPRTVERAAANAPEKFHAATNSARHRTRRSTPAARWVTGSVRASPIARPSGNRRLI